VKNKYIQIIAILVIVLAEAYIVGVHTSSEIPKLILCCEGPLLFGLCVTLFIAVGKLFH
jgi:hypothetical protein